MILNNIDNLYVGSTNALKVYLGSLLIWALSNDDYDVIPTDITSYTGSKSRVYVIDVDKWYMRTVGGNYKEYGVYASSKSADPYVGELAIDNGHEWEYTSNGWVDLGAYSEPEYFLTKTSESKYDIFVDHFWNNNYKMVVDCYFAGGYTGDKSHIIKFSSGRSIFEFCQYDNGFYLDFHGPTSTSSPTTNTGDYTTRVLQASVGKIPKDGTRMLVRILTTRAEFFKQSDGTALYSKGTISSGYSYCTTGEYRTGWISNQNGNTSAVHSIQIVDDSDNVVNNFVVKRRNTSGDNEFYVEDTVNGDVWENSATGANFTYSQVGTLVRPKDYAVIPSPVDVIPTDITSYTGSKSCVYVIDVDKWYMRTVGGNYTEYGIYASSKSADPYVGELAIDNGHEWEYTENGWVDLGNNSSRLPSDYTELACVGVRTVSSASPYITLNYYPKEATVIDSKFRPLGEKVVGHLYYASPSNSTTSFNFIISNGATGQTTYWRFYPTNVSTAVSNIIQPNNDYVFKSESSGCWLNNTKIWSRTGTYPSQNTSRLVVTNSQNNANFNLYYFNISENSTALYTLVPSLRNSDNKVGLYDITNNSFYLPDNESTNPYSAGDVLPYPKDYAVIPTPYDVIPTDITSYTGSKSCVYVIDVDKWYMRTIGGNYKEYGIIASSKSADPYIGELAIDNYHEWEYTATGWVDLGNNSSRLPSDYTELTHIDTQYRNSNLCAYIILDYYPKEATVIDAKFRPLGSVVAGMLYYATPNDVNTRFNFIIGNDGSPATTYWRFPPQEDIRSTSTVFQVNTDYVFKSTSAGYWVNNTKMFSRSGTYASQNTAKLGILNSQYTTAYVRLYYFNVSENDTPIYTLVPSLRNSDNKIGLYDMVNNSFHLPDNESTNPFIAGDVLPYPKDYPVIPSPLTN